jgi:hypothetical protein
MKKNKPYSIKFELPKKTGKADTFSWETPEEFKKRLCKELTKEELFDLAYKDKFKEFEEE